MEQDLINAAAVVGTTATDLSILSLVLRADVVVKAVIILLVAASVWCWAIIFEKLRRLRTVVAKAEGFEEPFWSGGSLDDLYDRMSKKADHPMAVLFTAAMREWRRSHSKGLTAVESMRGSLHERMDRVMQITVAREMDRVERNVIFLATTGSTAPFIGLFGTVWGIMNSFQAIALSKNTSLAVVAPGIAEALFATALGLLAAIPAVVAYNKLSNDIGRYAGRLEAFSGEFSAILSRRSEVKA